MPSPHISFAKIVSTPTETTWSQAYNAGALFAVISLTTETETEDSSVVTIGKNLLTTLETEFFTLDQKSLALITEAVTKVVATVPDEYQLHLTLACIKENILYIVIHGGGKVILKRNQASHTLFEKTDETDDLLTASGFLENADLLVLQTSEFSNAITKESLQEALDLNAPNDISETLTPHIHETQEAGAAAIILTYHGVPHEVDEAVEKQDEVLPSNAREIQHPSPLPKRPNPLIPMIKDTLSRVKLSPRITHMKRRPLIFLLSAVILGGVLIGGIYTTKASEKQKELQTKLQTITQKAQNEYDEGQALVSLNKNLARDHFVTAEKVLLDAKDEFPKDSTQEKELLALLATVQKSLEAYSGRETLSASPIDEADDPLLSYMASSPDTIAFAEGDEEILYALSKTKITQKDGTSEKTAITNDEDFPTPVSIAAYNGNIYILDTTEGVLKYTPTQRSYSKSSYFPSDTTFDTKDAVSMAIDGSVWILTSDGGIHKFTRGSREGFTLTGLPTPFTKPTKIFTDVDTTSLYILDPASQSITVFAKTGAFGNQYTAPVLKDATHFVVREKDKKIFVLAKGKPYLITLP